jgi:hypothetical protein
MSALALLCRHVLGVRPLHADNGRTGFDVIDPLREDDLSAVPSARYAETGFWFNTAPGGLGNAEFTSRFPGIREALLSLPCKSAIIDAEVVARREDGSPDFRALHSGNYSQEDLCV